MIYIGLTGWGDHDLLYEDLTNKKDKLRTYGAHFPIVELDATYYSIQPERNIQKWLKETPEKFKFIVKIHQALTTHAPVEDFAESRAVLMQQFIQMIEPMYVSGKLGAILIQFPPWFDCNTKHINYILYLKEHLKRYPLTIEFRHTSWFENDMKEHTLTFLYEQQLIHAVCDEPQVGTGCIPFVNRVTNHTAFVRYHGRNVYGWTKQDMTDKEWRDVRYLYDYNEAELQSLAESIRILAHKCEDIYCVFNNNSGGHAAKNAKRFIEILNLHYEGLNDMQLSLF